MPTNYASSLYLFSPIPLLPLPTENPPCDVHFSDCVPILVVCLVFVFTVFLFLRLGSAGQRGDKGGGEIEKTVIA